MYLVVLVNYFCVICSTSLLNVPPTAFSPVDLPSDTLSNDIYNLAGTVTTFARKQPRFEGNRRLLFLLVCPMALLYIITGVPLGCAVTVMDVCVSLTFPWPSPTLSLCPSTLEPFEAWHTTSQPQVP